MDQDEAAWWAMAGVDASLGIKYLLLLVASSLVRIDHHNANH